MNRSREEMNISIRVVDDDDYELDTILGPRKIVATKRISDISERTAVTAATSTTCSTSSTTGITAATGRDDVAQAEGEEEYEEASVLGLIYHDDTEDDANDSRSHIESQERPRVPSPSSSRLLVDYSSSRASLGRASSYRVQRMSKRSTERLLAEPEPETLCQERRVSALKKQHDMMNLEIADTEEQSKVDNDDDEEDVGSIAFYCRRLGLVVGNKSSPNSPASTCSSSFSSTQSSSDPQERLQFALKKKKKHGRMSVNATTTTPARRKRLPKKCQSWDTGRALLHKQKADEESRNQELQTKDPSPKLPIRCSSRRELASQVSQLVEKATTAKKANASWDCNKTTAAVTTTTKENLLLLQKKRPSVSTPPVPTKEKDAAKKQAAVPAAIADEGDEEIIVKPANTFEMMKKKEASDHDQEMPQGDVPKQIVVPSEVVAAVPTPPDCCAPQQKMLAPSSQKEAAPSVGSNSTNNKKKMTTRTKPGRIVAAQLDIATLAAAKAEKGDEAAAMDGSSGTISTNTNGSKGTKQKQQRRRGSLRRGNSIKKLASRSLKLFHLDKKKKNGNKKTKKTTKSMYSQLNEPEEQQHKGEEEEEEDLSMKFSQSLPSMLFVPGPGRAKNECLNDDYSDEYSTCSSISMEELTEEEDDHSRTDDNGEEETKGGERHGEKSSAKNDDLLRVSSSPNTNTSSIPSSAVAESSSRRGRGRMSRSRRSRGTTTRRTTAVVVRRRSSSRSRRCCRNTDQYSQPSPFIGGSSSSGRVEVAVGSCGSRRKQPKLPRTTIGKNANMKNKDGGSSSGGGERSPSIPLPVALFPTRIRRMGVANAQA